MTDLIIQIEIIITQWYKLLWLKNFLLKVTDYKHIHLEKFDWYFTGNRMSLI